MMLTAAGSSESVRTSTTVKTQQHAAGTPATAT
jgi:hypothetical protein